MYRVSGYFDKKEPILCIPLSQAHGHDNVFDHLSAHVRDNMFMAYRRPAAKFKRVVIASIGDHLNGNEEQDIASADFYLDIDIVSEPSKEMVDKLQKQGHWSVRALLIEPPTKVIKELTFAISKTDDMILARKLK